MGLVHRIAARFLVAGNVTIKVDVPATLAARKRYPSFEGLLVGSFDGQMTLYRVFDGEEMARILQSGKITGGNYAVSPERSMGASWGYDISAAIRFGNNARGKRLGKDVYLAKMDAMDKKFLHLGPENFQLDPSLDEQMLSIPKTTCNLGLGCSVANVSVHDVDTFYAVHPNDQIEPIRLDELKKTLSETPKLASRVVDRIRKMASYLNVGDIVLYGKYKNMHGKIVAFGFDKWKNPTIEVEPIPKGKKQNKIFGLFKVWRADVKERALKEMKESK